MFRLGLSSPNIISITIWKNQSEKHENQSKHLIIKRQQSCLGILPIAAEAFKITIQNGAAAASIFLPAFLLYFLLAWGNYLLLAPLLHDLVSISTILGMNPDGGGPTEIDARSRVQHFLLVGIAEWLFSCIIWIMFLVTSVSLSSDAYTGKKVEAKKLFSRIQKRWKGVVITGFYMGIIFLSVTVLFILIIGTITVVAKDFLLGTLIAVFEILGGVSFIYLATVWMVSMVVSVVEEGFYGLKAIDRAGELMKGKRLQGCALKLVIFLSSCTIYVGSFKMQAKIGSTILTLVPLNFLICALKFFSFMMFTVFYHDCRKFHEEGEGVGEMGLYDPIASAEV